MEGGYDGRGLSFSHLMQIKERWFFLAFAPGIFSDNANYHSMVFHLKGVVKIFINCR